MDRNNIWIHITLAVVLIVFAAVLGQIERWRTALNGPETRTQRKVEREIKVETNAVAGAPEVLVRFKPGVSLERIRALASANHDQLTDEIESVSGLTVIDDLDNANAEAVAAQYAAMSDTVAYAEPNFQIKLDDPDQNETPHDLAYRQAADPTPNDPQFGEQWALNNLGQDGGKKRADLDALKAWATTTGSDEVVVAVLDSGVDYTHEDLRENMWLRPANIPAYVDDELGTFPDLNGYDGTSENGEIRDPMDDNGHGTHCAGIIGAEGNNGIGVSGINWKVKIMPLKFLGRGGFGSTNDAIEAINYAIDRKKKGVNVRVISASWGSTSKQKLGDTMGPQAKPVFICGRCGQR
jgi:subtilisin family serine protease